MLNLSTPVKQHTEYHRISSNLNSIPIGKMDLTEKEKNEFKSNTKPSLEFLFFESVWLNLFYFRELFKSMERWR